MATSEQHPLQCGFQEWMTLQELELSQLLGALTLHADEHVNADKIFSELVKNSLEHFEEYMNKRSDMSRKDVSHFFAPSWNTSFENSLLWISGCRPSSFIRLLYALCGSEVESQVHQLLKDGHREANYFIWNFSAKQLFMVNELQATTIKEEENLTRMLASLQEETADQPFSLIAKGLGRVDETCSELEQALDKHEIAMATMLEEADKLRLSTLKKLISILTPGQAVDFLATGKKLHLCMHEWGKRRDLKISQAEGTSN